MPAISDTAATVRDRVLDNLDTAERITTALIDVLERATSVAVPVALVAVPDRQRWVGEVDGLVESGYGAARSAVSDGYRQAARVVTSVTGRLVGVA